MSDHQRRLAAPRNRHFPLPHVEGPHARQTLLQTRHPLPGRTADRRSHPRLCRPDAAEQRAESERQAKAEHDANLKFDEVWAMFDVDEHPKLKEAIELADREGVKVAVSNPCFELWALLHFEDQRGHIERKKLRERLKRHMKGYDKELDFSKLRDTYEAALTRAKALHEAAKKSGQSRPNPSTDAYLLTETIRTK